MSPALPGSPATTAAEGRRLRLIGLVYVVVVAAMVWFSIALYQRTFSGDVHVVIDARSAAQQLNPGGDVRMNGAIVGRVRDVEVTDSGARIDIAVDAEAAARIPTDVVARILPTTLFGQKFVELRSSSSVLDEHLVVGDTIPEDTSAEAVELTALLDDLDTVLTGIKPDQLATALGALAGGLDGRGSAIAGTFAKTGDYLAVLNKDTPLIERDFELLSRVAGQYADATPDLVALLRSSGVTARTLVADPLLLNRFLTNVSEATEAGGDLLRAAEENLAESARIARPTLRLIADYSAEIPCTIEGFIAVERSSAAQIRDRKFQGHFTTGAQKGGYTLEDRLVLGDLGTGPACRGLPSPPVPYPGIDLDDGVEDAASAGRIGLRRLVGEPR